MIYIDILGNLTETCLNISGFHFDIKDIFFSISKFVELNVPYELTVHFSGSSHFDFQSSINVCNYDEHYRILHADSDKVLFYYDYYKNDLKDFYISLKDITNSC